MNGKLEKTGIIGGISSAFIAVVAFVFSVFDEIEREEEEELRRWQMTAVYEIIGSEAPDSISFDEIQARYQDLSVEYGGEIPREELRREALRRVILELIASFAIENRYNDRFATLTPPPRPPAPHDILIAVSQEIERVLTEQPNSYTRQRLATIVSSRSEAPILVVDGVIRDGILSGIIVESDDNRLSLR